MRLHVIQHVPFEGPALIAEWAAERGHELTAALALTEEYPSVDELDFVVVMGGPMDADDEVASPWLHAEKHFLVEAISSGRLVLGVCLGAQIVAEVLGGRVRRSDEPEIGWHSVAQTPAGRDEPFFRGLPETLVVGQWHGPPVSRRRCRAKRASTRRSSSTAAWWVCSFTSSGLETRWAD